ncbi:hypothetical protein Glove_330g12 [Diversispora epigaea]|uniref:Ubiquitin-like domain-containing protein n=1 Tax=Diversispora epigaea TaxID=1348612 RepID=A0A397HPT6_9GLOM|nr:hypothetical protein Glove_330g12 [Diversispora epigaea]
MGCCFSRTIIEEEPFEGIDNNIIRIPRGGNKPFTKRNVRWMADTPITMKQLKEQRDAFWYTAPSYEGRLEIWQALRCACECDDIILAQAILDSANITIPTGNLADSCYDELGNRYIIPAYCIVDPSNLYEEGDEDEGNNNNNNYDYLFNYNNDNSSSGGGSGSGSGSGGGNKSNNNNNNNNKLINEENKDILNNNNDNDNNNQTIKIRISNTAKDVNIKINTKLDTIATLKIKLCIDQGIDIKRSLVRFFFLGSLLDDKLKLEDLDYNDEQVLQALISEKP